MMNLLSLCLLIVICAQSWAYCSDLYYGELQTVIQRHYDPINVQVKDMFGSLSNSLESFFSAQQLFEMDMDPGRPEPARYFGFVPKYEVSVIPGAPPVSLQLFHHPCFEYLNATAKVENDKIKLKLDVGSPKNIFCSDGYIAGSMNHLSHLVLFRSGSHIITFDLPEENDDALRWDLLTNGVRLFRFIGSTEQRFISLIRTVDLFRQPLTERSVSKASAKANIDFLEQSMPYAPKFKPRSVNRIEIDESLFSSGDSLAIMRLDGVDPMLAWAMGANAGHTVVLLRDPDTNELFVLESTAKTSYWPVNGIQKTPFKAWMDLADKASFNVVWMPLSAEATSKFNATAAWEFFRENEGFDYGYENMLWPWVDTISDNYPLLAPDFTLGLTWQHMSLLAHWVHRLAPAVADRMFHQAWNTRLGAYNLTVPQLLREARTQGIPDGALPTIVEQDTMLYNRTRNGEPARGRAMVCCVFVCSIWKAAGLFGPLSDSINCGEFTIADIYGLKLFDQNKMGANRPQVCKNADPENYLCQLTGLYSMQMQNLNRRPISEHMAEKCPSRPPSYQRPEVC